MSYRTLPLSTRTKIFVRSRTERRAEADEIRRQYVLQVLVTGFTVAAVDLLSIAIAMAATWFAFGVFGASQAPYPAATAGALFAAAVVLVFYCVGLYKPGIHPVYEVRQLLFSIAAASLVTATHLCLSHQPWQPVLGFLPIAALLIPVTRSFARNVLVRQDWWGVRCLVFGADRRVDSLYKQHMKNATNGLKPAGFLQASVPADCSPEVAKHFAGRPHGPDQAAAHSRAACALLHRCGRNDGDLHAFIEKHLTGFARIIVLPDDPRLPSLWSLGAAGYSIEDNLVKPSAQVIKRAIDVSLSLAALVFGFPVLAALALWVKFSSPGPVFFGHTRIGKDGRRFKAWKFRSMVSNAAEVLQQHLDASPELRAEWEATFKLRNDPRITSAGRFLRKTSLDELPQLWNVLVGEMSLVGPRPIVGDEINRYKDTFRSYLRVTPGITGFWQVSGRNLTTYERRVELDEFYVRNWSVWFDIYILFRTVKTALLREGAF
jgi:Undecaprenyl-phosphate galactose phosphotransferase WbaP